MGNRSRLDSRSVARLASLQQDTAARYFVMQGAILPPALPSSPPSIRRALASIILFMPTKLTRKEVSTSDDKYRPRELEEIEGNGISIINEPIPPENVRALVRPRQRSVHAVLCEAVINTQALVTRLEFGVQAPPGQARVTVRELYVQTRRQLNALAAVLELEGLE